MYTWLALSLKWIAFIFCPHGEALDLLCFGGNILPFCFIHQCCFRNSHFKVWKTRLICLICLPLSRCWSETFTTNTISQLGRGPFNMNPLILSAGTCTLLRQQSAAYASRSQFCLCHNSLFQRTVAVLRSWRATALSLYPSEQQNSPSSKPAQGRRGASQVKNLHCPLKNGLACSTDQRVPFEGWHPESWCSLLQVAWSKTFGFGIRWLVSMWQSSNIPALAGIQILSLKQLSTSFIERKAS